MTTSQYIWSNGHCIPWKEATVHVMSHALHYGSSVFEGIRSYETPQGVCIFRLTDHIERLFHSAKIYRMKIPFSQDEIIQACKDIIKKNNLKAAYIRPLIYLGDVGMGLRPPEKAVSDVIIAAFPWGDYLGEESITKGVTIGVSSWNRLAPNTMPTAAKAGGNYLSSQLISCEAHRHGYDEGVALDVNHYVSEGAGQNIFLIRKGIIYTPPGSASILQGLTRDVVIQLAQKEGYIIKEEKISRETLYLADEIFMTGTATEIVPVRKVDGLPIAQEKVGTITQTLQALFFGLFNGKTPDPQGWLESIESRND
jgi:branched-chain amino acid aminotransferase